MRTILIVDDSPISQRMLQYLLRSDYTVLTNNCGTDALNTLETREVDLLLLDIAMPGLDGMTVLERLRNQEKTKDLPVVMITASGYDEDRLRARALGAAGFITKPFSSSDVLDMVTQVMVGHSDP